MTKDLVFVSLGGKSIRLELDSDDGDVTVDVDGADDFIIPTEDVPKVIDWLKSGMQPAPLTSNLVSRLREFDWYGPPREGANELLNEAADWIDRASALLPLIPRDSGTELAKEVSALLSQQPPQPKQSETQPVCSNLVSDADLAQMIRDYDAAPGAHWKGRKVVDCLVELQRWRTGCTGKHGSQAPCSAVETSQPASSKPKSYVQCVPNHCDRIAWRGSYYMLPLSVETQPATSNQRVRLLIDIYDDGADHHPPGCNPGSCAAWAPTGESCSCGSSVEPTDTQLIEKFNAEMKKPRAGKPQKAALESTCLCAQKLDGQIIETHFACPMHGMKTSNDRSEFQCSTGMQDASGRIFRCTSYEGHAGGCQEWALEPGAIATPEKVSALRCVVRLQYAGGESRCTRDADHDGNCVY